VDYGGEAERAATVVKTFSSLMSGNRRDETSTGAAYPFAKTSRAGAELDPSKEIVVHCKVGERSGRAAEFCGVDTKRQEPAGGIQAWAEVDRACPCTGR
jgi:rhodanese-related sulfurtransferase